MKRLTSMLIAITMLPAVSGCGQQKNDTVEYIKITPHEAQLMMEGAVVILDVRTQQEYDEGHIPDAVLLPDFEISERAGIILDDKTVTILVYCRSGRRSESAARELIEMGYLKVYDFGGILDWPGEIIQN